MPGRLARWLPTISTKSTHARTRSHDARGSQTRLERRSAASSLFDPLIDQYANLRKVEAAIVRAIARGETALYGETRDYVRRVLSRLQTAR